MFKHAMRFLGGFILLLIPYTIFVSKNSGFIFGLTHEDGVYENLQAIFFFAASILFLISGVKRKNIFMFLLGFLFIFATGEEISWGQRVFGFSTPSALNELNVQHETNIHNLRVFNRLDKTGEEKEGLALFLNFERIFSLFWLFYCFLIPAAALGSRRIMSLAAKLTLPLVPLGIGVFFPVNYAVFKVVDKFLMMFQPQFCQPNTEAKELVFAVLFFLVALSFLRQKLSARSVGSLP